MAKKKPTLFIIDGSNNVYRSYYAIRNLTNSAGFATNAVYGFVQMLRKLLKDHKVAEDDERHAQIDVQKLTDRFIAEIDKQLAVKEADLMVV